MDEQEEEEEADRVLLGEEDDLEQSHDSSNSDKDSPIGYGQLSGNTAMGSLPEEIDYGSMGCEQEK